MNTIKIKGLSGFIEKYKAHIDLRVNKIIEDVKKTWKGENLWNSFSTKQIRDWVIWELLAAITYKGKLIDDTLWEYDIEVNWLKIDIKTLCTKQNLSSLWHLKLYLQAKQIKEEIYYIPCLLNYSTDEAIIIWSHNLKGEVIKWNLEPRYENPPFTSTEKEILNYVIPYKTFL